MNQLKLPVDPPDEVERLSAELQVEWPNIARARENAREALDRLDHGLADLISRTSNFSFVVYGSLARREFTQGSDLDWTLLVDGPADPAHVESEIAIRLRLRELGFREPAPGGSFGGLTFSHDLVHKIGGEDDTNRNTTQRILLLLESTAVGDDTSHQSVVRNVLRRYIGEDYLAPGESPFRVPRFLQNDVARYWRTMAVDFAQKRRARAGQGWALRTVKLQMSRKLMYAAGLLSCFSCRTDLGALDPAHGRQKVVTHLVELVRKTPLDIVARSALLYFGEFSGIAGRLFAAYDEFLALLDDPGRRRHLERLSPGAEDDAEYQHAHEIGRRFERALTEMFFETGALSELTKRYGVF
jgi:predicted nucleotidyltransferase